MGIHAVTAARAVFLDRDGVLNEAIVREGRPYPPTLETLRIFPCAPAALAGLKAAGFLLIVATNQPDVARGAVSRESIDAIHDRIRAALPLDGILVCWHAGDGECDCRKPKPGLLLRAAAEYGIDLGRSFMIGDRWRDIDAGAAAGCRTVLIDRQYRERGPAAPPDFRASTLAEAAGWILAAG